MKNHFLFTLLSFFFASSIAIAQCPVDTNCLDVDMNFPANPDWSVSHGSPSVGASGFWIWSYNNSGEGVNFSGYNFVAGQEYTICFVANTSTHDGSPANANATFNIVGTNGPVVGTVTGSGGAPIPPVPAISQSIVNENWSIYPNPGTGTYTYTFTATGNWDNLWFYPSSATLPQVEISLSSIVICPVEPCDASFTVCLRDQGNGTSAITTTLNNPNHTITGMRIWENNILVYSGPHISYLGTAGNTYTICITAINNNTGEECYSCYTFCIGKEYIIDQKSDVGTLTHSVQTDDKTSNLPEELREKPLEKDLGITISPNPSSRVFEVSALSTENKMATVKVFDLNSRQVYSSELIDNQNHISVDLKDQPVGIYIVKIQYSDGSISQQKIVLEK